MASDTVKVETWYKVAICPRWKWLYMRIYSITDKILLLRGIWGVDIATLKANLTLLVVTLHPVSTVTQICPLCKFQQQSCLRFLDFFGAFWRTLVPERGGWSVDRRGRLGGYWFRVVAQMQMSVQLLWRRSFLTHWLSRYFHDHRANGEDDEWTWWLKYNCSLKCE